MNGHGSHGCQTDQRRSMKVNTGSPSRLSFPRPEASGKETNEGLGAASTVTHTQAISQITFTGMSAEVQKLNLDAESFIGRRRRMRFNTGHPSSCLGFPRPDASGKDTNKVLGDEATVARTPACSQYISPSRTSSAEVQKTKSMKQSQFIELEHKFEEEMSRLEEAHFARLHARELEDVTRRYEDQLYERQRQRTLIHLERSRRSASTRHVSSSVNASTEHHQERVHPRGSVLLPQPPPTAPAERGQSSVLLPSDCIIGAKEDHDVTVIFPGGGEKLDGAAVSKLNLLSIFPNGGEKPMPSEFLKFKLQENIESEKNTQTNIQSEGVKHKSEACCSGIQLQAKPKFCSTAVSIFISDQKSNGSGTSSKLNPASDKVVIGNTEKDSFCMQLVAAEHQASDCAAKLNQNGLTDVICEPFDSLDQEKKKNEQITNADKTALQIDVECEILEVIIYSTEQKIAHGWNENYNTRSSDNLSIYSNTKCGQNEETKLIFLMYRGIHDPGRPKPDCINLLILTDAVSIFKKCFLVNNNKENIYSPYGGRNVAGETI